MVQHIIAVFESQMRSPLNEQQKKVRIFEVYYLSAFNLCWKQEFTNKIRKKKKRIRVMPLEKNDRHGTLMHALVSKIIFS